jgi:hypothetical protein
MSHKPLTVGMTPSFIYPGDNLFRAQLKCLSQQTEKDFDVVVIDSHYKTRRSYMAELAEKYKLSIIHIPYTPNLNAARRLDCAIFNAPYLFSESPKIVRYSCWRFVRPDFTAACVNATHCVDFYFHNVEPPTRDSMHPVTNHDARVWNMDSDEVHWDVVPKKGGEPGASWTSHSDRDEPLQPFPLNCFGNYMVPRKDWFTLNGCDEAIFSSEHWEDQDFCIRANNAGLKCERRSGRMIRMHHLYGQHSGRANAVPDFGAFKKICEKCEKAEYTPKPNRRELKRRLADNEIEIVGQVWVCRDCHYAGPVFHADEGEYQSRLRRHRIVRSNIIPKFKLGRNLSILAADMDGKSLNEKVEIFNRSYTDDRYYQP